ncbi:MAG TPA: protein phosphatase 2C domain-containing protein [Gemmatimonadales bacterium]|jgi:protein phosphatase|nr:protein phosphatase 2C domain-containing protein [Gemmatimonadales bacterium]
MPALNAAAAATLASRKPREDEIDAHGVTHPGKIRKDNQDHFILCSLRKQLVLRLSSIPEADGLLSESERLASLAMVADGVGGAARGETASRLALQAVTRYVSHATRCYFGAVEDNDQALYHALEEAARQCHADLVRLGEEDMDFRGMATTLTLYLGVWPRAYLLQVGDSRCYLLRNGELTQITRDQTMAQEMVDLGVMKAEEAAGTRLAHTLTSSIGGRETHPTITRFEMNWGHILLLCSDGLTRHVSDERIRDVLRSMTSARQACETLLQEALDGGGSDNITVVVGRAVRKEV